MTSAAAQVSQFEGRPIVDIAFSPEQPLDPADLAKAQPLKKGEPLRAEDVARAIDGLFATGRFEDIVDSLKEGSFKSDFQKVEGIV